MLSFFFKFRLALFSIFFLVFIFSAIIYFGFFTKAPQYLHILQVCVKLYISFYLIIKFSFFNKKKCGELDKKIAFNAGVLLLTTIIFDNYSSIVNYINTKNV